LKEEIKIPLPPPAIQQKIIAECEAVDRSASSILAEGISLPELAAEMKQRKDNVFKKYL